MVQGLKKNMLTLSSCYLGPQFNRTKDLWSISTVIGSVSMRLREYDNDSYRYLIPEKPETLGT
ncbi:hypothetical protein MTR_8g080540 [Medicago truncatula]|uniref:Uncharacterized protein n=1 Tax=Medicago truncatula TaxID=3880 RepID=A0A072TTS6_MEDTR|nr:hypothetical protein MTR_8g080540 [Medicago truncatula]